MGRDVEGCQGETAGGQEPVTGPWGRDWKGPQVFHLPLNVPPRYFLFPDCLTLHHSCPYINVTGSSASTPMVSLAKDLPPLSLVMGSCLSACCPTHAPPATGVGDLRPTTFCSRVPQALCLVGREALSWALHWR